MSHSWHWAEETWFKVFKTTSKLQIKRSYLPQDTSHCFYSGHMAPQVVINNWLKVDLSGHYNLKFQDIYWWLKYRACWMNRSARTLTTKSMFVVSYKMQGQWFILRKSVGPWSEVHSSILRSENPARGMGFRNLEWQEQMGRRMGHGGAREEIWQFRSFLNGTWK